MPGTSSFPGALDSFPAISANTQENAPGAEHDVVHANVHAAVAALQAKVGVDASTVPGSLDARAAALEAGAWKAPVRCADTATAAMTSGYAAGDTVGGVVLALGDRFLRAGNAAALDNGIYTANASGAPTRAVGANTGASLVGATVKVTEGTYAGTEWTCTTAGPIVIGTTLLAFVRPASSVGCTIGCVFDGGGAAIIPGAVCDVVVPADCSITASTLLADRFGSIVISVWADSVANFPPTVADNIAASALPTIAGGTQARDTALTGWTKALPKGRVVRFTVQSCTNIQRATLTLEASKT